MTTDEDTAETLIICPHCLAAMYGQAKGSDSNCPLCVERLLRRLAYRSRPRQKRPALVDFSLVPEHQEAMHNRLENWARSCNGGYSPDTAPGFSNSQSTEYHSYDRDVFVPVDRSDATLIARGVYMLPQPHMQALQWYYVKRSSPMQGRKAVACTADQLARYVIDGRQMLINRGV